MFAHFRSSFRVILLLTLGLGACSGSDSSWTEFRSTVAPEVSLNFHEELAQTRYREYMDECASAYFEGKDLRLAEYEACVEQAGEGGACWATYVEELEKLEAVWLECVGD